jgi:hypothetical protein
MYGKVYFLVDHSEPEMHGLQRIDAMVIRRSPLRIANRGTTAEAKTRQTMLYTIAKPTHAHGRGHR